MSRDGAAPVPSAVVQPPGGFGDPEMLRRLSSSVSSALDEAADALTRMKVVGDSLKKVGKAASRKTVELKLFCRKRN